MLKMYELLTMRTDLSRTEMHCWSQSRTMAANEGVKWTICERESPSMSKITETPFTCNYCISSDHSTLFAWPNLCHRLGHSRMKTELNSSENVVGWDPWGLPLFWEQSLLKPNANYFSGFSQLTSTIQVKNSPPVYVTQGQIFDQVIFKDRPNWFDCNVLTNFYVL